MYFGEIGSYLLSGAPAHWRDWRKRGRDGEPVSDEWRCKRVISVSVYPVTFATRYLYLLASLRVSSEESHTVSKSTQREGEAREMQCAVLPLMLLYTCIYLYLYIDIVV